MLELLFVLYVCQAAECQVLVVVPTEELCEQQKVTIVQQRGEPPAGVTLSCEKYKKS